MELLLPSFMILIAIQFWAWKWFYSKNFKEQQKTSKSNKYFIVALPSVIAMGILGVYINKIIHILVKGSVTPEGLLLTVIGVVVAGTVIQSMMVLSDAKQQINKFDDKFIKTNIMLNKVNNEVYKERVNIIRLTRQSYWSEQKKDKAGIKSMMDSIYKYHIDDGEKFEAGLRLARELKNRDDTVNRIDHPMDRYYLTTLKELTENINIHRYIKELLG